MSSSHQLTMRNVHYRIAEHELIRNISLTSAADTCTALLGANGAGKSTFLRLCHGLLTPSAGEIRWGNDAPEVRGHRITMVFQKPCLLRRSAYDNVDYALGLGKLTRAERAERCETALRLVHLTHRARHPATMLSGGEQRRLAIARAWAVQPEIILLDEPISGLDVASSQAVEQIILDLARQGIKIMLATHQLAQVRRVCDEIIFLDQGQVIQQSSTEMFFDQPKEKIVCDFINSQTFS